MKRFTTFFLSFLIMVPTLLKGESDQDTLTTYSKPNYWRALALSQGVNVAIFSFNRFILNTNFSKITWNSIKQNFSHPPQWDNDQITTNFFDHPYNGGLFYNAARSNGISQGISLLYALGGSFVWEYIGENEPPSTNDLLATTLAGFAFGEATYRASNNIFNNSLTGYKRVATEIFGTLVSPIHGINRLITGEMFHTDKSGRFIQRAKDMLSINAQWCWYRLRENGDNYTTYPTIGLKYTYEDPFSSFGGQPYDYFTANITLSLGKKQPFIQRAEIIGIVTGLTLLEKPNRKTMSGIFQRYYFEDYEIGKEGDRKSFQYAEPVSAGWGIIHEQQISLYKWDSQLFINVIPLGGYYADHYPYREYNFASGYGATLSNSFGKENKWSVFLKGEYSQLFSWSGYNPNYPPSPHIDPLYINFQGDQGYSIRGKVIGGFSVHILRNLILNMQTDYYIRYSHYDYFTDSKVIYNQIQGGITYQF